MQKTMAMMRRTRKGTPKPRPSLTPREVPGGLLFAPPGGVGTTVGTTVWMPVKPLSVVVEDCDDDGDVVVVIVEEEEVVVEVEEEDVAVEDVLVGNGMVMVKVESTLKVVEMEVGVAAVSRTGVPVEVTCLLSSSGTAGSSSLRVAVAALLPLEQSHAPER